MMTKAAHGPTVLRILLGAHLRRLRESRGISAQQAAKVIRGSESKISRIELGRNAIREIDILDLLTYYGVERDEREQLLTLAEQANRPGWWHRHTDILPEWFQTYVGMEESAASIRLYEPQFVPGLLQTEQYAAAVLALGDFSPEDAERHVLIRKERQRRFARGDLKLWVIIEEAGAAAPGQRHPDPAGPDPVPAGGERTAQPHAPGGAVRRRGACGAQRLQRAALRRPGAA